MAAASAFNDDDPQNRVLADEMGVVMGTSHHEPMMRAQDEWHRHTEQGVTGGEWDYATNAANLRKFWRGGIERMMSKGNGQSYESIVTVGMRGDGDEPMTERNAPSRCSSASSPTSARSSPTSPANRPRPDAAGLGALQGSAGLLRQRHAGARRRHAAVLRRQLGQHPPAAAPGAAAARAASASTTTSTTSAGRATTNGSTPTRSRRSGSRCTSRTQHGARALWIVNVGDLKPMEFPLSFFLDMAWNPQAMTLDALTAYPEAWAAPISATAHGALRSASCSPPTAGSRHGASPSSSMPSSFPLGASTKSTLDPGEFGRIVGEWRALEEKMLAVKRGLPKQYEDAYFQLVEHPISAFSNLYGMYYAVAWNRRLASAHDSRANAFADHAEAAYRRDQELTAQYHAIAGGKWDGMMSQVHIGYTGWNDPPAQKMPAIKRVAGSRGPRPIVFEPASDSSFISIEAPRYSRAHGGKSLAWQVIPGLGAVTALPQGRAATAAADDIRLEYDVTFSEEGETPLLLYLAPTLDMDGSGSLRIGVSLDDSPVQIVMSRLTPTAGKAPSQEQKDWVRAVSDNQRVLTAMLPPVVAGRHTIKIWRLDDNVLLQRLALPDQRIPEQSK